MSETFFDYGSEVKHNLYGEGKVVKRFENEPDPIYGVDFKFMDTVYVPWNELKTI